MEQTELGTAALPKGTRQASLDRLRQLVEQASRSRGLKGLHEQEVLELGRLYRYVVSELSQARAHGFDETELAQLNALAGRAYGLIYVTESRSWGGLGNFYRVELPRTLRRCNRFILLAASIFLLGGFLGTTLCRFRPDVLALVSPDIAEAIDEIAQRHAPGKDWLPQDFRPIASSSIMVNNIQVSFLAFSTGVLFGLGTIYVLAFNGFILGGIAAGISATSASTEFFAFVAPHGVIELPSIIIAGAAGLLLGQALVDPGVYSRLDALRRAGREAAVLMLGVASFLVVAGIVEGFVSPSLLPPPLKFGIAGLLAFLFGSYILLAGHDTATTTIPAPSPQDIG